MGQADAVLAAIVTVTSTQRRRLELAYETLDEIRLLNARVKRSKTRITEAVKASGTTLTGIYGVGPIISSLIIGYAGDVTRLATSGHFATPSRCNILGSPQSAHRTVVRDQSSGGFYHGAVSLLCSLGRRAEEGADLLPGQAWRCGR